MAGTVIDKTAEHKLMQRIALLEETIYKMRANQVNKIAYGNILIDGTGNQGVITIGNGITITVDGSGNGIITLSGSGKIVLGNMTLNGDGSLTVTDGTNGRVIVGYQSGGF